MQFPLEKYISQLFFNTGHPLILSPSRYWRRYCIRHCNLCFKNNWIEHCWRIDYGQYTRRYPSIVVRHHLEEDEAARLEYCFHQTLVFSSYCHPIELFLDVKFQDIQAQDVQAQDIQAHSINSTHKSNYASHSHD